MRAAAAAGLGVRRGFREGAGCRFAEEGRGRAGLVCGAGAEGGVGRQAGGRGSQAAALAGCTLSPQHCPALSGCCSHLTDEETEASLLVHLFQDLNSPLEIGT